MKFGPANGSHGICILGMHRSGTSVVSRAVNLLGVYLGETKDLAQRNESNPEGFWEHAAIVGMHNRLLAHLSSGWDRTAPLPAGWDRGMGIEPFRNELRDIILANFAARSPWGWKDPRTCLFLPLWRHVLGQLGVSLSGIFVVRNPLDVANSLGRRDAMPLRKAMELWFHYNIAALESASEVPLAFL